MSSVRIGISKITLDISKLEAIERELKRSFVVRVGVLGANARTKAAQKERVVIHKKEWIEGPGGLENVTSKSDASNADIGLVHEKGSKTKRIPRRSFIQMPLELKMPGIVEKLGPAVMAALTKENIRSVYKRWGILAENVIQVAFATRGYGRWPDNAPATIAAKRGSDMPLIDTAQLRKAISSEVVSS